MQDPDQLIIATGKRDRSLRSDTFLGPKASFLNLNRSQIRHDSRRRRYEVDRELALVNLPKRGPDHRRKLHRDTSLTPLLTVDEVDAACKKAVGYKAPGA